MRYWKTVDAGEYLIYRKKFFEYFVNNPNNFFRTEHSYWNGLRPEKFGEVFTLIPEMCDGIIKFGTINDIALLIVQSADEVYFSGGVRNRLQIPIMNTEGSRTAFFKLNEEQYKNYILIGDGVRRWPQHYKDIIQPIDWFELNQPTIVRTKEPHTQYFDSSLFPRITITISFRDGVEKYLDEENT